MAENPPAKPPLKAGCLNGSEIKGMIMLMNHASTITKGIKAMTPNTTFRARTLVPSGRSMMAGTGSLEVTSTIGDSIGCCMAIGSEKRLRFRIVSGHSPGVAYNKGR